MENKRSRGSEYEKKAAEYLKASGLRICEMNYRCRLGEIDIIARDGRYLVFAEVKYRMDTGKGFPQEAVDYRKQRKISQVADYYLMCKGSMDIPCRFDVIAILGNEIRWIKDAFPYRGNNR